MHNPGRRRRRGAAFYQVGLSRTMNLTVMETSSFLPFDTSNHPLSWDKIGQKKKKRMGHVIFARFNVSPNSDHSNFKCANMEMAHSEGFL